MNVEPSAILLDQQHHGDWAWITLGSAPLAAARPGQFLALRCAQPGSYDPLVRESRFIAATDVRAGTTQLLLRRDDPACAFLSTQRQGIHLDILGPLGHGWNVARSVRTVALVGTAAQSAPLVALAHQSVAAGLAVSVGLGTDESAAPPAFLLPAAAEYNIAQSPNAALAAVSLLDDQLLRWADLVAVSLPSAHLPAVAQRIRAVRLQWNAAFAQAAVLPPLACCIGVCGVCVVETHRERRLACVDGPIFDLRELVR